MVADQMTKAIKKRMECQLKVIDIDTTMIQLPLYYANVRTENHDTGDIITFEVIYNANTGLVQVSN